MGILIIYGSAIIGSHEAMASAVEVSALSAAEAPDSSPRPAPQRRAADCHRSHRHG